LEINQTDERLRFDPIPSAMPNRGSLQTDIEQFGLTYTHKITDSITGKALHVESGIWTTQPGTMAPLQSPPPGGQIVTRMAAIVHGSSLLAQGTALPIYSLEGGKFTITPVNTAPFPAGLPMPAGGTQAPFPAYDLSFTTPAASQFRTPFGNRPPIPLPLHITAFQCRP
jgi:hypothetical protein